MFSRSKNQAMLLILFCLSGINEKTVFAWNFPPEKQSYRKINDNESKILDLINEIRLDNRMNELNWNDDLAALARSYSKNMAQERFFSHYNRNGETVVERARKMKIDRWKLIGENLFKANGIEEFSRFAVKSWMKSPQHKKNIMERRFNETGIGIARSSDGTIYVTQVFIER